MTSSKKTAVKCCGFIDQTSLKETSVFLNKAFKHLNKVRNMNYQYTFGCIATTSVRFLLTFRLNFSSKVLKIKQRGAAGCTRAVKEGFQICAHIKDIFTRGVAAVKLSGPKICFTKPQITVVSVKSQVALWEQFVSAGRERTSGMLIM